MASKLEVALDCVIHCVSGLGNFAYLSFPTHTRREARYFMWYY